MKKKRNLRSVSFLVFVLLLVALGGALAFAADEKFPNGPINLIVPQAAGGQAEAGCRLWQPFLEAELGVPLNFEFFTGAGSLVGYNVMLERKRDGYHLGLFAPASMATTILTMGAKYKLDDFDYVGIYQKDPGCIFAHKDAPWSTLQELIDYAKTQPEGSIAIAVSAVTDINVIGVRQLEEATGVKFNIVPFNGGGKARAALAGNQVSLGAFMYYGTSSIWENTKVLGVNVADTVIEDLKDVQTFNQVAGKVLDDIYSSNGIVLPGGTKEQYPERYEFILGAVTRAWSNPELQKRMVGMGQANWLNPVIGEDCQKYNQELFGFFERNQKYMIGNE